MIKNIIFDLGNVLISFKPAEYLERKQYSENLKTTILNDIFRSKEWLMLDNGDITISDAIDSITSKSSLKRAEIVHIFNLRTDIMFPLDQNVSLLPELKKRGFRLYYLSNFPQDIFNEVRSGYYFFRYFNGGLISADAKSSKPDAGIYLKLMNEYSIIPQESLFIDDIEVNARTAESFGMKGLVTFGSQDISSEVKSILDHSSV
jgi:FMN phosphatase YigB (HAD superfamily)